MNYLELLKNLPPPLAFAGLLIVVLIVRSFRKKSPVIEKILEKIRRDPSTSSKFDQRLTAKQLENLLREDQHFRELAGEQDFRLLQQVVTHEYHIRLWIIVGVFVCALSALVTWALEHRDGTKLDVGNFVAVSNNPVARGLLVDLDSIDIAWQSSGKSEELQVYLENLDSHIHSVEIPVPADAHRVEISPDQYRSVLRTRTRNGANRIRIVAQSKNAVFTSNPLDLRVGITVLTVVDGDANVTVAAMIDQERIPFYGFEARIVVPSKTESANSLIIGDDIPYQFRKVKVAHPHTLDWDNARGAYLSPDDQRLIRFNFLVDDALRSPVATGASRQDVKLENAERVSPSGSSSKDVAEIAVQFYNGAKNPEFTVNGKAIEAASYSAGLARFRFPEGAYLVKAIYPNRVCQASLTVPPSTSDVIPADCHLR